ncbi:hypothetical protein BC830DRAFT_383578 [Chytriomyces sp. MP71]|nr:hypothetical protein BC830DRAFT_383578 [Chytriomyces sp. MP71]
MEFDCFSKRDSTARFDRLSSSGSGRIVGTRAFRDSSTCAKRRQMFIAPRWILAFQRPDEAGMGWFNLRTVLAAGVGSFTDAGDTSQALPILFSSYFWVLPTVSCAVHL